MINKETGAKLAVTPEELPPLREGYIRLVHQTNFDCAESLLENGLVYNREYAKTSVGSKYSDVTSMAVAYDENGFWNRLTREEIRHKSANAIAIFSLLLASLIRLTVVKLFANESCFALLYKSILLLIYKYL